jgi:hypothetical protein
LVYFTATWYILRPFGIFYYHLVYFTAIWYIYGHLVYFTAIWYSLCSFGIYFSYFGMFGPRKIWQPLAVKKRRFKVRSLTFDKRKQAVRKKGLH